MPNNRISQVCFSSQQSCHTFLQSLDDTALFTDEETQNAQSDLLETRAQYVLRNDVTEAVVTANPILKAVHSNAETAPIERYVLCPGELAIC